jgi:hypothetical protein
MPGKSGTSRATTKGRKLKDRTSLLRASIAALAIGLWAVLTVIAQSPVPARTEGNALPPTTGKPLTIKPVDMQDVDCTIAQWNASASRPTLTIICPPDSVFAPLRVLIKLSWMKPEQAPVKADKIPFRLGALTKIRTNKDAAQIWLLANRAPGGQAEWVAFDAVDDLALLVGYPKSNSPKKAGSSTDASSGFPSPKDPTFPAHFY